MVLLTTLLAVPAAATANPPSNDNRESARAISVPQRVSGTTVEATDEQGEPRSNCATSKGSVWYRFSGNGGLVALSLVANGDLDAVVEVFAVRRSQTTLRACDSTNSAGFGVLSLKTSRGTDYLIRVAGRSNSVAGNFTLNLLKAAEPARPPGKRLPSRGISSSVNLTSNPSDAWSIRLTAGKTYRINLASNSSDVACLRGGLYKSGDSPDEGPPVRRLSCGDGYTLFTPGRGKGGRYSIFVESATNSLSSQRYRLQVGRAQRDDTGPGLFWSGLTKRGSLNGRRLDGEDLYNWDLNRTAFVGLRVASRADFEVVLLSVGGRRLACSCDGAISRKLKPGTYFALVFASFGARGSYTLKRTVRTITKTSIGFNGSKNKLVSEGASVRLGATVTPAGSGKLIITLERKDPVYGWQYFNTYTGSGSGGGMSTSFTPPGIGEWRAKAEFKGSKTANPSKSGYARLSIRR